jgi:HDOD domain
VLKTSVLEFPAGNVLSAPRCFQYEIADELPDVPALPETLLTMEFQLQENSVDLRGFTEVVLGDLGATIQILRMAGREYGSADDCPVRIEDCISDLGLTACVNAAARGTFARGPHQRADFEIWTHSREIAQYCRMLAEEMPASMHSESINPDQAYIAGLLHGIGALPDFLGWQSPDVTGNRMLSALKLAEQWCFPRYLKDFFCENLLPGYSPNWSQLLAAAHRLDKASWARCPLDRVTARSLA